MTLDIEVLTTAAVTDTGSQGARQFQGLFTVIPFTFQLKETSIAAKLSAAADITVTGAELGDFVFVTSSLDIINGVLTAFVQSANTVTIQLANEDQTVACIGLAVEAKCNGFILKPNRNVLPWGP